MNQHLSWQTTKIFTEKNYWLQNFIYLILSTNIFHLCIQLVAFFPYYKHELTKKVHIIHTIT